MVSHLPLARGSLLIIVENFIDVWMYYLGVFCVDYLSDLHYFSVLLSIH